MPIPDQCPPQNTLFNTHPSLSSFACDILKLLGLPNVNPVIQQPGVFDYSKYTTVLEQLSGQGDPRWSMGAMFTDLLDNVFPHIAVQTELLQAGGCQIIDQFICDSNGRPIKTTSSSCSGVPLTIDNAYIQNYIQTQFQTAKTSAADQFIKYIRDTYINQQWTVGAYMLSIQGIAGNIFYLAVVKAGKTEYVKYYPDQAVYVAAQLDIHLTNIDSAEVKDTNLYKVLSRPIINISN